MSNFTNTIKRILAENKSFARGQINGSRVESNSSIYNDIEVLGNVSSGECLIAFTETGKIAIPAKLLPNSTSIDTILFRRGTPRKRKNVNYDYCLLYSYVDLNYNPDEDANNRDSLEKDTVNPDVSYAVRKNRVVTKAPECPLNMLHLGHEDYKRVVEPNFYGIPLLRYPYYSNREEAINIEDGRYYTSDILPYPVGDAYYTNNFENQITRQVEGGATYVLETSSSFSGFNPLVPIPPSLTYSYRVIINLNNIRTDGKIGEKVIRFKYSNDYELELLKLHPYEIYKTYINQLDNNRFEICIKAGLKIDYDGFPKDQWDMKDIYEQIQNGNYLELSDDHSIKDRELVEITYEQLYVYKWCKGFYFVIDNGEIEREETFTPLDDYESFDYSIFEDGVYNKVFACSYCGNWDKFNLNGEPAITEDYYGNEIKYSDYLVYDFNNNLQNIRKYEDDNYENINESNYVYVQKHNVSWEWGNLYAFPNENIPNQSEKIPRLYSSISFSVGEDEYESEIYNVYNDHDYGYKNLTTFEKHILKLELNGNYANNLLDDNVLLIFSNMHNTLLVDNSMVDYGFYFNLDYPSNKDTYDDFSYVNFVPNATVDYFPDLIHSDITILDSEKKPWDYDYYSENNKDGEEEFSENKNKTAKLEFKLLNTNNIDDKPSEDNLEVVLNDYLEIGKFEIHQKNLTNVFGRGNLDYEKFHIENIYICEK